MHKVLSVSILKTKRTSKKLYQLAFVLIKKVQGARTMQILEHSLYPEAKTDGGKVAFCKDKDLRQLLKMKRGQPKDGVPSCTTWSPKPRKFKKESHQDKFLGTLEDNTFYPLTQKERIKVGRRRLASVIVRPSPPPWMYTKHPKKKQHLSINNATELVQFKDFLQKKKESRLQKDAVDFLALPVYQLEGTDHTLGHSKPMVVR